jgi:hypothetical protein
MFFLNYQQMLCQLLRRNMRTPVSGKGRDCWLVRRPWLPLPADGRAHARRRTQEIIGAPHVWVGDDWRPSPAGVVFSRKLAGDDAIIERIKTPKKRSPGLRPYLSIRLIS